MPMSSVSSSTISRNGRLTLVNQTIFNQTIKKPICSTIEEFNKIYTLNNVVIRYDSNKTSNVPDFVKAIHESLQKRVQEVGGIKNFDDQYYQNRQLPKDYQSIHLTNPAVNIRWDFERDRTFYKLLNLYDIVAVAITSIDHDEAPNKLLIYIQVEMSIKIFERFYNKNTIICLVVDPEGKDDAIIKIDEDTSDVFYQNASSTDELGSIHFLLYTKDMKLFFIQHPSNVKRPEILKLQPNTSGSERLSPQTGKGGSGNARYENRTLADLKILAKSRGMQVSNKTKTEIIAALRDKTKATKRKAAQ